MSATGQFDVRNLVFERFLPASRDKVFDALTRPGLLKKWFLLSDEATLTTAEIDLRTGAKYRIGIRSPEGTHEIVGGIFKRCVRPESLSFTWSVGGGGTQQKKSQVDIDLIEKENGTDMVLKHLFIPGEVLLAKFEREWEIRLQRLEKLLFESETVIEQT